MNREISEIIKLVEPKIKEVLELNLDSDLKKEINYQISSGGKRIRPIFLLTSCLLFNGRIKDALYPAAGIEILHNYSLIIDDIIDNSFIRRNKPTVWNKYGKDIAQCLAIAYAASIFQAALLSKKPELISNIFALTIKKITEGEVLDILYERSGREKEPYITQKRYSKITKNDYLKMIGKKTAVLFSASCQVGAFLTKATKKQISLISDYGFNVGLSFQIQDDILDIFGKERSLGKEIGKDIKERKGGNIVILLALEELNSKDRKELSLILKRKKMTSKDVSRAIELIKKTKARDKASLMAKRYIIKAKGCLESLPNNKWNQKLALFADFMILRDK